MEKISPEKAEILGLLCAEGSYYEGTSQYYEHYPERNKTYLKNHKTKYIQFGNFDKKLLNHFKFLIKKEYNHDINLSWDRARICKRIIIEDILKCTPFGVLKWKVPTEVIKGNKTIKIKFLRGYFDGDGTVSSQVRMFSSNKDSLEKVSQLLTSVGINNLFKGPYFRKNRKPSYYIYIRANSKDRFLKMIKPISKKPKKKDL